MRGRLSSLLLVLTVATMLTSACTTSSPGGAAPAEQSGGRAQPATPSRLALVLEGEPANLASKLETLVGAAEVNWLTNSPLAYLDNRGIPNPRLGVDLPSQEKGTWVVNPDGTMTTRWTIRPNALWHDGQPVTSNDFVFALRAYQDPDVPVVMRDPERLMDHIQVDDNRTFTIFWKQTYPWAFRLINREMEPLPAHLLQSVYEGPDKSAFVNSRFWSTEYIGDGPFRLEQREPGVSLKFRAFDQYYLGRPKIDEVVVTYTADPALLVSQFLSGTADIVGSGSVLVTLDSYTELQDRWNRSGEGRVLVGASSNRYFEIQQDPARTKQPALLDVRVRRALAHAMDREGVAHIIVGPDVPAGDHVFAMYPTELIYPQVDQAAAKYPYDPRRALELLQQAGWTKQGDTLVNTAGESLTLDMWSRPGLEKQVTLFASNLQDVGIKPNVFPVPSARLEEPEFRATFPGLNIFGTSNRNPMGMQRMTSAQCPMPPRYAGTNYGCWSNAEYDRSYQIAINTLNEEERTQAIIAAYKAMYDDVGFIWLNYNTNVTVTRRGLEGPIGPSVGSGVSWNVHEWEWVR